MKKSILVLGVLIILLNSLNAQEDNNSDFYKNYVHVELLGNGVIYSFNYERNIFNGNYFQNNIRVGVSFVEDVRYVIPVEYLFIKGYYFSFFELGLGYSPLIEPNHTDYVNFDYELSISELHGSEVKKNEPYTKVTHNFMSRIGYRYQGRKGFLLKVALTPRIYVLESDVSDFTFDLWGGVSFGYCF